MYVVLQTKPDCVNVYCYKYVFILNSDFSFYFVKITYQGSIFNVPGILFKFTWFCFYFIANTWIHHPRLLICLGRLNHHQCILKNPIEKHWSLYVQLIANYLIRHPRSLIRLSKLNHHPGDSGTP